MENAHTTAADAAHLDCNDKIVLDVTRGARGALWTEPLRGSRSSRRLSSWSAVLALLFLAPKSISLLDGISFYALTDFGTVIGVAIALVSLSAICLGFGLWPSMMSVTGRTGAQLRRSPGACSPSRRVSSLSIRPGAAPTLSGTIHNIAGLSFVLAIPAVLLVEFSEDRRAVTREESGKPHPGWPI